MRFATPFVQRILLELGRNFTTLDIFEKLVALHGESLTTNERNQLSTSSTPGQKFISGLEFATVRELLSKLLGNENMRKVWESKFGAAYESHTKPTPFLDSVSLDLTDLSERGTLDEVVGREGELISLIRTLLRRKKGNVVIVGEAGVGKTALVELLAQKIVSGEVPPALAGQRIISLDMNSLVADQRSRGDLELRIQKILQEVLGNNVILFIDEIHRLLGSSTEVASSLKQHLTTGELRCIGATTRLEYARIFARDEAFKRRFQVLDIDEPGREDTLRILQSVAKVYGTHHGVLIPEELLPKIVTLCERYMKGVFPDKAIDIVDELCSSIRSKERSTSAEKPADLIKNCKFEEYARMLSDPHETDVTTATESDLLGLVRSIAKISQVSFLDRNDLIARVSKEVFGNRKAVEDVCSLIGSRENIHRTEGCSASFMFTGPDGSGRRHLSKVLARTLFGSEKGHFLYINMKSYTEKHQVAMLTGAPPGYIGWEGGGLLTNFIRDNPYCVIYLEHAEESPDMVLSVFKSVVQEGSIPDSYGQIVDCRNCIVIVSHPDIRRKIVGFVSQDESDDVDPALQFLDKIVVFKAIESGDLAKICRLMVDNFVDLSQSKSVNVTVHDEVVDHILSMCKKPKDIEVEIRSNLIDTLSYEDSSVEYRVEKGKIMKKKAKKVKARRKK